MTVAPGIQVIIDRDFPPDRHPYRILEQAALRHMDASYTVLDVGCGRTAPNLVRLKGRAKTLIGVDLVKFETTDPALLLVNADICNMRPVATGSVDLAYSRSVMEHIKTIRMAYSEINRVLKPGGKYIVLTPNAWDYVSIIARLVPNRFHARIAHMTSERNSTSRTRFERSTSWLRQTILPCGTLNILVNIRRTSPSACHCFEWQHLMRGSLSAIGIYTS